MELKEWFEKEISPLIQADGGWLEMRHAKNEQEAPSHELPDVSWIARGECAHCAALERCLHWIGMRAARELGQELRWTVERVPFIWRR